MLTVGEIFIGKALDLDYQGQAIIKHHGYVVFVRGMLPEEEGKIRITKMKKNFGQGEIVSLLKISPDRIDSPNHVYGSCNLIHLSGYQQLLWQQKITRETFKKIMNEDVYVSPTITDGKENHYRNKSVFHVMDHPSLALGLYHYDEKKLIPVESFILSDEPTNRILSFLFVNRVTINPKVFKYMIFRTNQNGQILITFGATKVQFTGRDELVNLLKRFDYVVGITININNNPNQILGDRSETLYGENLIMERLRDMDVAISDQSFFQINLPMITKAYDIISDEIGKDKVIVDAYSGVGSIGFYLSNKASKIIMIESNQESVRMARRTIETYGLNHLEIIEDKAEKVINSVDGDILIVDPPRNGLMPEFIQNTLKHRYEKMFYLSCDVKTLTRDLMMLSSQYQIKDIYPLRMFYHTTSLETLVVLYHL